MNTVDPIEQEHSGKFKEVGSKAIWSLSTCRPGKYVYKYHIYDMIHM